MANKFKYYLTSVLKTTEQSRTRERLLKIGFLPWELSRGAHKGKLVDLKYNGKDVEHSGFARMRSARAHLYYNFLKEADRKDWGKTEALKIYRQRIDKLYSQKRYWAT